MYRNMVQSHILVEINDILFQFVEEEPTKLRKGIQVRKKDLLALEVYRWSEFQWNNRYWSFCERLISFENKLSRIHQPLCNHKT